MGKVIGAASDFYRLRLTRLDIAGEPDLEWRDDILYREPPKEEVEESAQWRVEAVTMDDEEEVHVIALFDEEEAARALLAAAEEDLKDMTKSAFESRYMVEDE